RGFKVIRNRAGPQQGAFPMPGAGGHSHFPRIEPGGYGRFVTGNDRDLPDDFLSFLDADGHRKKPPVPPTSPHRAGRGPKRLNVLPITYPRMACPGRGSPKIRSGPDPGKRGRRRSALEIAAELLN